MDNLINNNLNVLFSNIKNDSELEIMFNNYKKDNILFYHNYINVLNYIKYRSIQDKLTLKLIDNLDIAYAYEPINNNIYRITINEIDHINNIINGIEERNNSIIFSLLASKILKKEKNITIIEKIKDSKKKKDLDEYDIRIRLAEENKVNNNTINSLTKLKNYDKDINYRFKQRISLIIENNKNYTISIDLTNVKSSNNIKNIINQNSLYEVEIDLTIKNAVNTKKDKDKILKILIKEIQNIKSVLEYNYNIITNTKKKEVIDHYNNLLQNNKKNIYSMNVISLQSENIVDDIIMNYSITDKADGEHYALMIYNNYIYLISSNLEVKFTNILISNTEYNNTILDGELIYLKNKKFLFTSFDILYYKNKDIRNTSNLEERIEKLDDVIKNILDKNFNIDKFNGEYKINNLINHHDKELDNYLKYINSLVCNKDKYIFSRKYYMFTVGLSNNEIFKYSWLLWNKYTSGELNIWAYQLDGLIYTPLNQIYTNKLEQQKYKIFKWKPPIDNTIDFYYKEVNYDGKELNVIDNTNNNIKDKPYRLGNLYVGDFDNNTERPILFREDEELHKCKFYTVDGVVKDKEGNVIESDTVIECYYNKNEPDIYSRWKPLRTRYDKTYNVKKFKRKYGNFKTVADNVWKSIKENNNDTIIRDLSNDNLYEKTLIKIKENINLAQISRDKSKETYYKKKVDIAKNMRNFHNFIKSIIIYKYCYTKKILDIGIGRGGDLMKFYHSRVKSVVGLDVDSYELESTTDGPKSRYKTLKQKFPGFPQMEFGLGDAGVLFNLEDQQKVFSSISSSDKNILINNFGSSNNKLKDNKFQVFNCQFMIHFVFKSDFSLNNFCENLNNFLEKDGYLLITTLDGSKLHELFKNNKGIIESYYNDTNEDKKLFFRFKANYNYEKDDIEKTGLSYDSYLSFINEENEYYTEYLVDQQYIINTLKNRSNLSLIETCSFSELYDNYKLFFEESIKYESDPRTKLFFMKIKEFYTKSINHEQIFSFLNRMYIFKKN